VGVKIRDGETILFIGDSITDCGRRGVARPLGDGYVKLFADMLALREPARRVAIINKGIGGNRITDLHGRWTDDVMRHRPDLLSVKIGINDLHNHLSDPANGVTPKIFEELYDNVLARTRKALPKCRILLIDPFYISRERSANTWRHSVLNVLRAYVKVVDGMTRKYGARHVKTHEMFQKLLKHYEADTFCGEPVHPNLTGHLAIAEEVYKALCR
jgi:lysophospholipase L1-like esterase